MRGLTEQGARQAVDVTVAWRSGRRRRTTLPSCGAATMPLLSRVRALFRTRSPPFQVPECYDCHAGDRAAGRWPGGWRCRAALGLCALGLARAGPPPSRAAALRHRGPAAGCRACRLCETRHGRAGGQPRRGQARGGAGLVRAARRAEPLAGTGLQARYSAPPPSRWWSPPRGRPPDGDRPATVPLAYAGVLQRTVTRARVSGAARSSASTGPRCSSGSAATASWAAPPLAGTGDARATRR